MSILIFNLLPRLSLSFLFMKWFEGGYQSFFLALSALYSYEIYIWFFNSILSWIEFLKTRRNDEKTYIDFLRDKNFPRLLNEGLDLTDPSLYLSTISMTAEIGCDTRLSSVAMMRQFDLYSLMNKIQARKRLSMVFTSAIKKHYQLCNYKDSYEFVGSYYNADFGAFVDSHLVKICEEEKISQDSDKEKSKILMPPFYE